jgi:quinol monooxygenase YgiN
MAPAAVRRATGRRSFRARERTSRDASDSAVAIGVDSSSPRRQIAGRQKAQTTSMENSTMHELIKGSAPAGGQLALAVTWEAKEGEAEAVAEVLRRMADEVKAEPGTLLFWPHRSPANDRVFFLYELFADENAFLAHQQTDYFKNLVLGQAVPKLARRERVPFMPLRQDLKSAAE